MKRRILSWGLALALVFGMTITASAYTDKQMRAADALNRLDLFRGRSTVGKDFALDSTLSRAEGTVLLLRVIGEEAEAKEINLKKNPFSDVTEKGLSWAVYEVTYAYNVGLVKGTSSTTFAPNDKMSDCMFLTLLLRHLGYKDGNNAKDTKADFIWNNPYVLAKRVGLITSITPDDNFTRGDAVLASWNAMEAKFKGTSETLAESLIDAGVFDESEYEEAREIWAYGDTQDDDSGLNDNESDSDNPSTPVVPDAGDDDSNGDDDSDSPNNANNDTDSEEEDTALPWENGGKLPAEYTWAEFEALNTMQQTAFQNWFASIEAFDAWLQKAQSGSEGNPWENGGKQPSEYTYEEYEALTAEQQMAFFNSFDSIEAFDAWLQKAQSSETYPWENGGKQPSEYTYEEYDALTAEQQMAFFNSFDSVEAFDEWLQKAQSSGSEYPWENGGKQPSEYSYEEYEALTAEQQMAFFNSFDSIEAFDAWLQKAQS